MYLQHVYHAIVGGQSQDVTIDLSRYLLEDVCILPARRVFAALVAHDRS
jgi:hypothetical protein